MSSEIMLEECFVGLNPKVTSYCDCNPPYEQAEVTSTLPAENETIRTVTATCGYCGEEKTFIYELQEDNSWCLIDD